MNTIYDSGWVTGTAGPINAVVRTEDAYQIKFMIAASGSNGAGTTTAGWSAGGTTPVPWTKNSPTGTCLPLITGTYTVAAPAAQIVNTYYIGVPFSATNLAPTVPQSIYINSVAGAGSWVRVIVEGQY